MLYLLLTGIAARRVHADQDDTLRAIRSGEPALRPTRDGLESWPALEAVLSRMLAPRPEHRFASLEQVASAFRSLPPSASTAGSPVTGRGQRIIARAIERACDPEATVDAYFPDAPRASGHAGAAGLAWLLYRKALADHDHHLLAQADRWARLAAHHP